MMNLPVGRPAQMNTDKEGKSQGSNSWGRSPQGRQPGDGVWQLAAGASPWVTGYSNERIPKYLGIWNAGAGQVTGDQVSQWGWLVSSAHL